MKDEVKTKYNNLYLGGLSSFNMDFTSRGLSWAEDMYQKLERVCKDRDMVQIPYGYVDEFGEHIKNFLDEFAKDWFNPSDGSVAEPVSDLSVEHNVVTKDIEKPRVGLDENATDEKLSDCVKVESIDSLVEDPSLVSNDVAQELSQENTYGEHNKNSTTAEAMGSYFSDGAGGTYVIVSKPFASPAALTSDLPSSDEVCPYESYQNNLMEGGSMLPGFQSSTDIHDDDMAGTCTSPETICLLGSLAKEHEQQIEPTKLEDPVRLPEIDVAKNPDGCDWVGVFNDPDDTEDMELFEDVKLEDCWDGTQKHELALISHPRSKTMSYKKKLWRALISKVRSSEDRKKAESFYRGFNLEMQNRERIGASSVSSGDLYSEKSSTHNSCENDWELV